MKESQDEVIVNKNCVDQLIDVGLTPGEAKVYLAMIHIGPSRVGKIVEMSGVSQSKIYNVLDRLILKGLASYNLQDNIKYFQSLEPSRLHEYIQRKEDEVRRQKEALTQIISDLSKNVNAAKRSTSEIFMGERSLRSAYMTLLSDSKRGDILRYFYPYPNAHENASPFYSRFYKYQKSKGLVERGIVNSDFKNSQHFKEIPKDVKLRHVNFPLPGTIDIFADKLLIIDWKTITGILITSSEIAGIFVDYFDSIWKIAQR
ncbi:TrmB family transcriptional regulator [Candidatus Nitrosocosmicus sp. FF01]|uniref:TrmB family transcriptional regulator n=1 Tax=Candidatus Nitrosocosmicus sp. FF01 TaxID=3397670 RepID=UPI0039ED2135